MALKLGDDTALRLGRVTLNPIPHIDIIGTVLLPLLMLTMSGFVFGWAKPVPVSWHNLHQPRRDMGLVALAGPTANLLMAIVWALTIKISWLLFVNGFEQAEFFLRMGEAGILINILLMILNLMPILPLDGGRILYSLLPPNMADQFGRLEPFGLIILLVLLVIGALGKILLPLINFIYEQIVWLTSITEPLLYLMKF